MTAASQAVSGVTLPREPLKQPRCINNVVAWGWSQATRRPWRVQEGYIMLYVAAL